MRHESSANRPEIVRGASVNRRSSATIQSYMDYNATAPVRSEVVQAVSDALGLTGNPSSVHQAGRGARALLERSRVAVAALVGAPSDAVVFTSGGTEANNQALQSVSGVKLVSAIEHDSVLAAVPDAPRLPVDRHGVIDLQALEEQLETRRPALVSVVLANNETGVIQPIRDVAACAHAKGALVHCDAVQAAGKRKPPAWTVALTDTHEMVPSRRKILRHRRLPALHLCGAARLPRFRDVAFHGKR
jgi:cysteine sulfinate desulfinase/cysteine desulfurase-like protein